MQELLASTSVIVAEDAHWFSGHFPGSPVLPGIAQLNCVIELISVHCGEDMHLAGLKRVKFRKLIKPGDRLDIEIGVADSEKNYTFKVTSNNEDVCSGKMSFLSKTDKTT